MKKKLVNLDNKSIKEIELNDEIFGIKVMPDIIHQFIRYQNAKSRQGSHKTKSRSEINGRAKKPFSQKGTGNARQGSSKPPNFRGKISENNIIFIESLSVGSHKTKSLAKQLEKFKFNSALFVYTNDEVDQNFKKASNNLPRISLLNQKGINVRDIITYEKIFIEEKSISKISERLL